MLITSEIRLVRKGWGLRSLIGSERCWVFLLVIMVAVEGMHYPLKDFNFHIHPVWISDRAVGSQCVSVCVCVC